MESMENITISFLGTGASVSSGRAPTAILVNDRILLDAAPTISMSMQKMGKDPAKVEYIFLTHYHADHTLGLPLLLCEYASETLRKNPLTIIGPEDVKEFVETLMTASYPKEYKELLNRLDLRYISLPIQEETFQAATIQVEAIPLSHGICSSLGYKLYLNNIKVAYTGNTELCPNLTKLVTDAEIVIAEMTSLSSKITGHMNLNDIKTLQRRLNSKQKLILVHLGKKVAATIPELTGMIIPEDCTEYTFTGGAAFCGAAGGGPAEID